MNTLSETSRRCLLLIGLCIVAGVYINPPGSEGAKTFAQCINNVIVMAAGAAVGYNARATK